VHLGANKAYKVISPNTFNSFLQSAPLTPGQSDAACFLPIPGSQGNGQHQVIMRVLSPRSNVVVVAIIGACWLFKSCSLYVDISVAGA
jgi:hypothetical protein